MSDYTFADYGSNYPEIVTHHYGYLIPINIQKQDNSYKAYQIYSLSLTTHELDKAFGELKEQFPSDYKNAAFYLIRKKRDQLLSECDWVVAKYTEKNQEIPTEWKVYRRTLRDLPDLYENPDDVVFPEKP